MSTKKTTDVSKKPTAKKTVKLLSVEELGKNLPGWKLAGVMEMRCWKPGKQVTKEDFEAAVMQFDSRSMGTGRQL